MYLEIDFAYSYLVCFPAGPQGSKSSACDTWTQKCSSTGFSSCFLFLYVLGEKLIADISHLTLNLSLIDFQKQDRTALVHLAVLG